MNARGAAARLVEWTWRGRSLEAARLELSSYPPHSSELYRAARTMFELGELALSHRSSSLDHERLELAMLYRNAELWAAQSLECAGTAAPPRPHATGEPEPATPLAERRSAAARAVLRAHGLHGRIEALEVERAVRAFLVMLLILGLASAVVWGRTWLGPTNLAVHASFRTSSEYRECDLALATCGDGVFFHTREEDDPWFEYDLGRPTLFSSLTIRNRMDCCLSRAVPLIVEASDDGTHFRTLATREAPFGTWEPEFAPQQARFVRLRVRGHSALHLRAVEVHE